ncbi:MAG: aminotransferase class V-fold PLP-dependent enzyme [Ruminococcaceae bacterium]|nr:aminotransferase class V-fold PLP-dependent enzyme [Oscillospiraceae bacterium]
MIYLDNAATTLIKPPEVKKAMTEALDICGNAGRGGHEGAQKAAEIIFEARVKAADVFGTESAEQVVFTQNATHALNIAIKGIAVPGECVISGYEHNSVVRPLATLSEKGVKISVAKSRLFDSDGMVRDFRRKISKDTKFCVCTHVSNVFGYILPIKEIDEICFNKGIPLIIDASQSAGVLPVKLNNLRAVECICAPGHKGLYGPQGTGILICRNGEKLKTLIEGGTGSNSEDMRQPEFLPDRLEAGTQNLPGIAGLSAGLEYIRRRGEDKILVHERKLVDFIVSELVKIPQVKVFCSREKNLQTGVVSFVVKGLGSEKTAEFLAEEGIAVRSGKHCAPLAHGTVGTSGGTVRVSVCDFTKENDVFMLVFSLKKIIREKLLKNM